ncbi:putative transporter [Bifidobacterium saguini DSM 23967]|uniref:MFS transporter n=2 Tax=Bifidobacterium saguini TaxID=762210 RepID=A0ABX7SCN7_9BIFI|nr:MFS transporter [Bifidobacterium saguini]KFI92410.1 putative transporter [Bifidobacterium saguini DSM 23967]QTB91097.1 MFS transporter [Bifidobacterium saguini]
MAKSKGDNLNRSLVCLCAAELVMMINTTAFNVALPNIAESLGTSMAEQQWIVSSYNLVFAAVVLLAGFLGDRLGHLKTMLAGLGLFVIASAIGLMAGNVPILLVSRSIMGAGAGIVIPMGQALLGILFRGPELSRAMTAWAIAGTLGVPFGPLIGGTLTATLGWRGIFGFDGVVFLAVIAIILMNVPRINGSRKSRSLHVPWASVAMMFAGFTLFSAGLVNAQHSILAVNAWVPMMVGVVLITGFVLYDNNSRNPLMELGLMKDPSFASCAPALMMLNFSMYGIIFIMPAYLETVLCHDALVGGLLLMPLVVASIVGARMNDWIVSRIGSRGTSLLALGCLATGMLTIGGAMWWSNGMMEQSTVMIGQLMAGLGLGAGQPAMLTWATGRVPIEKSGAGSSLLTVFRQFGSIIGVGIFGSIQSGLYMRGFRVLAQSNGLASQSAGSVTLDFQQAAEFTSLTSDMIRQTASRAYESAITGSFAAAAAIIVVTLGIVALISRKTSR